MFGTWRKSGWGRRSSASGVPGRGNGREQASDGRQEQCGKCSRAWECAGTGIGRGAGAVREVFQGMGMRGNGNRGGVAGAVRAVFQGVGMRGNRHRTGGRSRLVVSSELRVTLIACMRSPRTALAEAEARAVHCNQSQRRPVLHRGIPWTAARRRARRPVVVRVVVGLGQWGAPKTGAAAAEKTPNRYVWGSDSRGRCGDVRRAGGRQTGSDCAVPDRGAHGGTMRSSGRGAPGAGDHGLVGRADGPGQTAPGVRREGRWGHARSCVIWHARGQGRSGARAAVGTGWSFSVTWGVVSARSAARPGSRAPAYRRMIGWAAGELDALRRGHTVATRGGGHPYGGSAAPCGVADMADGERQTTHGCVPHAGANGPERV
jgi:hypothetical protein